MKLKRAYYLPMRLVEFDREADKKGYVREKVVAAAIYAFIESDPTARACSCKGCATRQYQRD